MKSAKILIVEDDAIIAKDLQFTLENLGFEVCGISNTGPDAIQKAKQTRPDLVLMDIELQDGMDGIEAATEIRKLLRIPIVYLTAYSDDSTLQRTKRTEPFGYLVKPFQERELYTTLDMALYMRKMEQERERLLAAERQARQEAESANQAKDIFLATLSHELRTPLTSILMWARLLNQGHLDPTRIAKGTAIIEQSAKALAKIIDDLLDISRIAVGRLALEIQKDVHCQPILRSVVESLSPMAETKSLQIDTVFEPGIGTIRGDPSRLAQIFLNLISNAIKFTPHQGRITASLRSGPFPHDPHAEAVIIEISDTGQGISPEFLPHIFERFSQADRSSTRVHGGLGLGLAIVKSLVELQGGVIEAQSPGLGKGTTFRVYFLSQKRSPLPKKEI